MDSVSDIFLNRKAAVDNYVLIYSRKSRKLCTKILIFHYATWHMQSRRFGYMPSSVKDSIHKANSWNVSLQVLCCIMKSLKIRKTMLIFQLFLKKKKKKTFLWIYTPWATRAQWFHPFYWFQSDFLIKIFLLRTLKTTDASLFSCIPKTTFLNHTTFYNCTCIAFNKAKSLQFQSLF